MVCKRGLTCPVRLVVAIIPRLLVGTSLTEEDVDFALPLPNRETPHPSFRLCNRSRRRSLRHLFCYLCRWRESDARGINGLVRCFEASVFLERVTFGLLSLLFFFYAAFFFWVKVYPCHVSCVSKKTKGKKCTIIHLFYQCRNISAT